LFPACVICRAGDKELQMIKINTKDVLKDYKGKPLIHEGEEATVGSVMASILSGQTSNPARAYQIGFKFATEKEVELKAEDIVWLKKELEGARGFAPIAVGQLIQMLGE